MTSCPECDVDTIKKEEVCTLCNMQEEPTILGVPVNQYLNGGKKTL